MEKKINIKKLRPEAILPSYGSDFSAGCDLCACLDKPACIAPGEAYMIPTGIAIEIPEGFGGVIFARSGLAVKEGLAPSNKVGVIDADYRGEIKVSLYNHSGEIREILPGQRIAQLVIMPYIKACWNEVDELSDTIRGDGGFGSTGA